MTALLTLPLRHFVTASILLHANHGPERSEWLRLQCLCKSVCNHVFGWYVGDRNFLISTFSRIQWCLTSMCFLRRWNSGFAVSRMAPLLSAFRLTGWLDSLYPKAAKNRAIHKASFSASVVAIYSSSVEERATVACCFDWWDTGPPKRRKTHPPVDLRPSLSPAQWKSVNLTSSSSESDLNVIPNSKVPAKYRKIWTTKLQWMGPGFAQYRLRTLTEYEMSGRVCTECHIREPIADWYHLIVARSACCSDG